MQPDSIRKFEILYLGAWGILLISTFLAWDGEAILRSRLGRQIGLGTYAAILGIGLLITPTLCYLAARKRSNVARWIIVALFALQAVALLLSLLRGVFTPGLIGGLGLLAFCLRAVAVRFLFGAEAAAWFGRRPVAAPEPPPGETN